MKQLVLLCLLLPVFNTMIQAQHHSEAPNKAHFPHFRGAILLGHTFVPTSLPREQHTVIPSWGLDIEYWFSQSWAIGLHNDLELQTFIIERGKDDELLEREFPLVLTLDALYRLPNGLVFQVGPGYEIERNESFLLLRAGIEYEWHLGHHWDIAPAFFYDTRAKANDTWTIALGFGKRF
ncbi:MAG TPA: hypothetical protein PKC76_04705 [Saprospiraceae bacterium]|nr:hypothetical protein [Saprospiraceae bacterium]HMP23406.1 hypothetical protein [Saprospiraceae bacterium]